MSFKAEPTFFHHIYIYVCALCSVGCLYHFTLIHFHYGFFFNSRLPALVWPHVTWLWNIKNTNRQKVGMWKMEKDHSKHTIQTAFCILFMCCFWCNCCICFTRSVRSRCVCISIVATQNAINFLVRGCNCAAQHNTTKQHTIVWSRKNTSWSHGFKKVQV